MLRFQKQKTEPLLAHRYTKMLKSGLASADLVFLFAITDRRRAITSEILPIAQNVPRLRSHQLQKGSHQRLNTFLRGQC